MLTQLMHTAQLTFMQKMLVFMQYLREKTLKETIKLKHIHVQERPQDKEKICALMNQAAKEGINSPAVEECITLLNTTDCIKAAAREGKELITQNCAKFQQAPLITNLFSAMIPEDYR